MDIELNSYLNQMSFEVTFTPDDMKYIPDLDTKLETIFSPLDDQVGSFNDKWLALCKFVDLVRMYRPRA